MRPHRLRLTAFGPFAGQVEVDFDAMAASGLFLLQGDTGAGKTSILDALAFALYGRVPGQRSGAGRLRSDHAAPDVRTVVELEVTLGRRRFRIERSPEQERPKQRGSGTTKDPAKVLLQEAVDGGWHTVSTRVGEADAELAGLLGMSADQFHQVVLLPQGEFARFLRSDAAERARLLQRLFSTDRFRRVEDWLADRRRRCTVELEAAVGSARRLAARVAQAAGVVEPAEDGAGPGLVAEDGVPTVAWASGLAEAAAATAADLTAVAARTAEEALEAEAATAAARDLQRRQRRLAELRRRAEELVAGEPERARSATVVDAGRRAAQVRSALEAADRRSRTAQSLTSRAEAARAALEPLGLHVVPSSELAAEGDRRRQALGRLDHAEQLDADLRAERRRTESARAAAEQADRNAARADVSLAKLPEQREELRARRAAAADAAGRVPRAEQECRRLTRALEQSRSRARLLDRRAAGREELLTAREDAVALKEQAQQLRNDRIDSMISELAAALVDGDPCPVCGASEHPDPSEVRGTRVTREQEDAAQAAADGAAQQVAALQAAAARLEGEFEAVEAALREVGESDRDPAEIDVAARAAEAEFAALQRRAAEADGLDTELDRLGDLERRLAETLAGATQEASARREQAEQAQERAVELSAALTEVLAGAPDVRVARAREQDAITRIEQVVALLRDADAAVAEAAQDSDAARVAAVEAGFVDVEQARGALMAPVELQRLTDRLEAARAAQAAVQAGLAEPELDVALDPALTVPVDLAGRVAASEAVRARADEAAAAAARAQARAAELDRLLPAFAAEVEALEPLRQRAREVRQIADLAAGQGANRLRMTLSAYVLAARLEEVAAVASERLRRMTQGRYTLVHTDVGRGSGRSGLGLLARDSWTGQDRDTATLSGGETFLASLALALALGDVVTAEAGGTAIDALFVDEGFGSLDEDTLDEVMDTLDGLREGGRMVGLVSHVGELRMRIPAQIHVRKGRHGSTVTVAPG